MHCSFCVSNKLHLTSGLFVRRTGAKETSFATQDVVVVVVAEAVGS